MCLVLNETPEHEMKHEIRLDDHNVLHLLVNYDMKIFDKDSKIDASVPGCQLCSESLGLLNDYVMRTSVANSNENSVGFQYPCQRSVH